jgi:hypothetical protein
MKPERGPLLGRKLRRSSRVATGLVSDFSHKIAMHFRREFSGFATLLRC